MNLNSDFRKTVRAAAPPPARPRNKSGFRPYAEVELPQAELAVIFLKPSRSYILDCDLLKTPVCWAA